MILNVFRMRIKTDGIRDSILIKTNLNVQVLGVKR